MALAELTVSLVEKMQAQEILRSLRLPEFDDLSQFFRNLPATALVGIGAFAAVVAYWFASRPKAVKPPCDLRMQSEEVEVRLGWHWGSPRTQRGAEVSSWRSQDGWVGRDLKGRGIRAWRGWLMRPFCKVENQNPAH